MAIQPLPTTAEAVGRAMSDNKLSQRIVAQALNVSQAAVSRRISGQVKFPRGEVIIIARLAGVPDLSLFDEDDLAEMRAISDLVAAA